MYRRWLYIKCPSVAFETYVDTGDLSEIVARAQQQFRQENWRNLNDEFNCANGVSQRIACEREGFIYPKSRTWHSYLLKSELRTIFYCHRLSSWQFSCLHHQYCRWSVMRTQQPMVKLETLCAIKPSKKQPRFAMIHWKSKPEMK